MSPTPTRRALGPALAPSAPRDIDPEVIRRAGAATGFTDDEPAPPTPQPAPVPAAPAPPAQPAAVAAIPAPPAPVVRSEAPAEILLRRTTPKSDRDQPFTTRLNVETKAAIYVQANSRKVPVAQVIEEAMAALAQQQAQSSQG